MNNATQAFQRNARLGDIAEPLAFGRIECNQSRTLLADIEMVLNYDFLNKEDYHVGLNARLIIPTGNASQAKVLFEPIIGNGKHWELGFGGSWHQVLWREYNNYDVKNLTLSADLSLTHLFASNQLRSYDFINNGPGSRYMLLEELGNPSTNLIVGGSTATKQYQHTLIPAINRTTLCSKIRINIQASLIINMAYQSYFYDLNIGYNLWGRSKEILAKRASFPSNIFAIKGDAQIYGFIPLTGLQIPLNASQNNATLHAGQGNSNVNFANPNADNPAEAFNGITPLDNLLVADLTDSLALAPINGSNLPILLQNCDINECSGLSPKAISHKLFTNFTYKWANSMRYIPFFAIGAEVEFGSTCMNNNSALSQWGIWLKGGFVY